MHSMKVSISLNGNLCVPSNGEKLSVFPQWLEADVFMLLGAAICSDHMDVILRCQEQSPFRFWSAKRSAAPSPSWGPSGRLKHQFMHWCGLSALPPSTIGDPCISSSQARWIGGQVWRTGHEVTPPPWLYSERRSVPSHCFEYGATS